MVAELDRAKRALVTLLRRLASQYAVTLDLTRDSLDADVHTAYRKVSGKTHPDRGGRERDRESITREREREREGSRKGGRETGREIESNIYRERKKKH